MILELQAGLSPTEIQQLAEKYRAEQVQWNGSALLLTDSSIHQIDQQDADSFRQTIDTGSDIQLAHRDWQPQSTGITIGEHAIGGQSNKTLLMAGPCAVESREQAMHTAQYLAQQGVTVFRAGAFKSRTSPYTFQGLGQEGLEILDEIRTATGMQIITEVRDATHVDAVIETTDIIQVGAKAMYDHGILRACASARKPVLLKRHFGATLQEFVQAAEFILMGGNREVILCERGIRTFEKRTRFTIDLTGVAWLKQHVHLPIVVDPSHAMGLSYGVPDLTRAAVAMGVAGVLLEVHANPAKALSDAAQQLSFQEFDQLKPSLHAVAEAIGYQLC